MNLELAVLALVLGSLAVTAVCRRYGVSSALVLVLAGLAASLIPGVVEVTFDPQVVLLLVLTPLLYSAALDSSYLGIRANKRPIGLLAVGLVAFTAVVVGVVAWWLIPGLTLAAGLVLGAVVAPPDAVSALAVGRRLNLPRRVMTDPRRREPDQRRDGADAVPGVPRGRGGHRGDGVGRGRDVRPRRRGRHRRRAGRRVGGAPDPAAARRLSGRERAGAGRPVRRDLLAESVHASGLLAVVVAGLYLGYRSPESGYATRLQDGVLWRASDTILESVVFALIGLQLTAVARRRATSPTSCSTAW